MDSTAGPTRWMALDLGSKRIGVAISDFLNLTARPLVTVERENLDNDVRQISELARQYQVDRIVVGCPLNLSGDRSAVLEVAERFVERLKTVSTIRVEWADERLSTKEAESLMSEHRIAVNDRRALRDQYAAALILTWYLEETTGGL